MAIEKGRRTAWFDCQPARSPSAPDYSQKIGCLAELMLFAGVDAARY